MVAAGAAERRAAAAAAAPLGETGGLPPHPSSRASHASVEPESGTTCAPPAVSQIAAAAASTAAAALVAAPSPAAARRSTEYKTAPASAGVAYMERSACSARGLSKQSRSRMMPPPTEVRTPHRIPGGGAWVEGGSVGLRLMGREMGRGEGAAQDTWGRGGEGGLCVWGGALQRALHGAGLGR